MASATQEQDLRKALSDLLRKKMLATVRRGVGTQKAEDCVDAECYAFLAAPGPVQVNDLVALEARIHKKLDEIGVAKRTPLKIDEWAVLFKFQSEVAEIAEKRRQEEIAKKREVLRLNLAEQVKQKDRQKVVEKEAVKTLAREQEEDLRKFKAEVLSKQARDRDRTAQLRIDRSVQLEEKTARVREEERQRKREEEEARRQVLREHMAVVRAEEVAKAKQKAAAEDFLRGNEEQARLKAEMKLEEERISLRMQHEFNERLRIQEEEHFAALEAMKAKQRRQEELGAAVGPYKRYLDESIIEKNFQKREAELIAREEAGKLAVIRRREQLKAGLDAQVEEKKRIKEALKREDKRLVDVMLDGARIAEVYERQKETLAEEKMHAQMADIQAQIRAAEEAKRTVTMSDTEKQINYEVLEMIPNSHIPLPPKGLVTSRYTPAMLAAETLKRANAGTTRPIKKTSFNN